MYGPRLDVGWTGATWRVTRDRVQLGNAIEICQTRIVMREFEPEPAIVTAVKATLLGLGVVVNRFLMSSAYILGLIHSVKRESA